jgi:hypothetical protein
MIEFASEPAGPEAFDAFVRRLLVANWEQPDGLLRLSADLKRSDLAGADFLLNTRVFLSALAQEDGAPATATGNLNRAFVSKMFDRLELPDPYRNSIRHVCKVINEVDLWPLHLVRVICECAGLVVRRHKHFQLSKVGRALLPDNQAGALFRKVFLAYFRRFDLHYDFHLRDVPGIQQTMAVILWRLDVVARDWMPVRGLAREILLPGVFLQLHQAMTYPHDTEEWILAGYILDPLFDLGLIERKTRGQWPSVTETDVIRVTALWRQFIQFGWNESR